MSPFMSTKNLTVPIPSQKHSISSGHRESSINESKQTLIWSFPIIFWLQFFQGMCFITLPGSRVHWKKVKGVNNIIKNPARINLFHLTNRVSLPLHGFIYFNSASQPGHYSHADLYRVFINIKFWSVHAGGNIFPAIARSQPVKASRDQL